MDPAELWLVMLWVVRLKASEFQHALHGSINTVLGWSLRVSPSWFDGTGPRTSTSLVIIIDVLELRDIDTKSG